MKSEVHSRSSAGPQSHPPARQPRGEWLQRCLEPAARCSLCRRPGGSCGPRPSQPHSLLKTFLKLQSAVLTSSLEFLSLFVLTLFKAFSNSSPYLRQIRSQLIPSQNCKPAEDRVRVWWRGETASAFWGELALIWACWSHPTCQASPRASQTPRC